MISNIVSVLNALSSMANQSTSLPLVIMQFFCKLDTFLQESVVITAGFILHFIRTTDSIIFLSLRSQWSFRLAELPKLYIFYFPVSNILKLKFKYTYPCIFFRT